MRIVHIVVGRANPDSLNGVSKAVHWMATSQLRLGQGVEVWGIVHSEAPRSRDYTLRQFPMTRLRVTLGRELKAAVSGLQPGTWVHFHSVFAPEFPAIAHQLSKHGIAYGITPHGGYTSGDLRKSRWKKRAYLAVREAQYVRNAAWIQAIGESEVEAIRRIAPAARVVLIPNCQEPIRLRVKAEIANSARPVFGYCGRLAAPQKGLDYLIDGFAAYKSAGGTGDLWLIGDGGDRAQLERQAVQRGVSGQVSFFGEKHGEEKLGLVASVDAFIHSSRWDGIPTACLEAAALQRPLLVSRETNLAEYVERSGSGLVLDETSAAGVARVLEHAQQLYEAGKLQQMGEKARALLEKEFRWEENARGFLKAVREAIHTV